MEQSTMIFYSIVSYSLPLPVPGSVLGKIYIEMHACFTGASKRRLSPDADARQFSEAGGWLFDNLIELVLLHVLQLRICSTFFHIEVSALSGANSPLKQHVLTHTFGAAGGRCFVEGGSVNPPFECFVTTPSDAWLAEAMSSGLYCMVVGHREAGKSSTVLAAKDLLEHAGSSVDVYHITLFGTVIIASQLWEQLGNRLHFLNSSRFPLPQPPGPDKHVSFGPEQFFSWFVPQAGRSRVAVVIDEAANMENMQDLSDVLSAFSVCRDQRMHGWLLHSLVLVGTERIVSMVANANNSGARLVSPYTVVRIQSTWCLLL